MLGLDLLLEQHRSVMGQTQLVQECQAVALVDRWEGSGAARLLLAVLVLVYQTLLELLVKTVVLLIILLVVVEEEANVCQAFHLEV